MKYVKYLGMPVRWSILLVFQIVLIFSALYVIINFAPFEMTKTKVLETKKDFFMEGSRCGARGNFKEAEINFKKTMKMDKSHIEAKECLNIIYDLNNNKIKKEEAKDIFKGYLYYINNRSDLDYGVAYFQKAISINSDYALVHSILGAAYVKKNILNDAIAEFQKAVLIDPNYAPAYYNLGLAYEKKGMLDDAAIEFKKAISLDSCFAPFHVSLGIVFHRKKMIDEAIFEYEKAVSIDPKYAVAYSCLAVIYYKKQNYQLAVENCDKAVKLGCPVHPNFLDKLKPYRKAGK